TGDIFFAITDLLTTNDNEWDAIASHRWWGETIRTEVPLDTEITLCYGDGYTDSPLINVTETGYYTINFNKSTGVIKITRKCDLFFYIDKSSVGNLYAWDNDGSNMVNYKGWPGFAMSELPTTTVNGYEYYVFTYTHKYGGMRFLFNNNGTQTADLEPQFGKVYKYNSDNSYQVYDVPEPYKLYFANSGDNWALAEMTEGADGKFTYTKTMEANTTFKFVDSNNAWWGGVAEGNNFIVTKEQVEQGTELSIGTTDGKDFLIPVYGTWTFTVDMDAKKVVISGDWGTKTLAQVLAEGVNNEVYSISDELNMVIKSEDNRYVYLTDTNGNWIRVEGLDNIFVEGMSVTGIKGVLASMPTAPTIILDSTAAPELFNAETVMPTVLDLTDVTELPKPCEVISVTGYFDGEKLRAYSGQNGEMGQGIVLDTTHGNFNLEVGTQYTTVMAVELIQPWEAESGAPRRIKPSDDNALDNIKGQLLTSEETPIGTGITTINANSKTNVRYYDMNGRYVGTSLEGAPAGIYVGTDGVKVRK
ncbi:MAG: starch-binding protein, partial [Muribaculaceae bacterium]|nr:starch-binding protein [Muribaculaceae bacterium]